MSNLVILPIILPLFAGIIVAFTNKNTEVTRLLTKLFSVIGLGISIYVAWIVLQGETIVLETGSWVAPYGIVFVADSLSVFIVVKINIISIECSFFYTHLLLYI